MNTTHRFPPTAAQQGVIDALALWPHPSAYLLAEYTDLRGDIDALRWLAAVTRMVEQTPAQRLRLVSTPDGAELELLPPGDVPIELVDVSTDIDPVESASRLIAADLDDPPDPYLSSTTRHLVIVLADDHVRWYHRAHHVALDGYGFALCTNAVSRLYRGDTEDDGAARYAELVADDLTYRASPRREGDRDYWHDRVQGTTPVSLARRRSRTTFGPPRRHRTTIGSEPFTEPQTLATAFIAAVAIHTARTTHSAEVVLGIPMMNRLGAAVSRTPAMILNVIPLRISVRSEDRAQDLLEQVRRSLTAAARHGRYRHEDLRRELHRVGGDRALFGAVVNVMPFDYDVALPEVSASTTNVLAGPVEDIAFQIYARQATLEICCDGTPDRYDSDDLATHCSAVSAIARDLITAPDCRIDRISRFDRILSLPASAPVPSVSARINSLCRRDPTATAIIHRGTQVSRSALDELIARRRTVLEDYGVAASDVVVATEDSALDSIVTLLAITALGATHVAPGAVAVDAVLPEISGAGEPCVHVHGATIRRVSESDSRSTGRGGYIVSTSGSTGHPKLVRVGSTALDCFIADAVETYGWSASDRIAGLAPLHTDTSVEEILVTLASGATLVLPDSIGPFSASEILELTVAHEISVLDLPTGVWHELVPLATRDNRLALSTLRQVIIGGEECSAELVRLWAQSNCAHIELVNTFGPSETAVVNFAYSPLSASDDNSVLGEALPHTGALIRYNDYASQRPGREPIGELVLFGSIVGEGYVGASSPRFSEVVVDGNRFPSFETGDLVSAGSDGIVRFHGREDDLIKIGGRRVHLRAIEDALLQLPEVAAAAVVQGGALSLVAYIVPSRAGVLPVLPSALQQRLPDSWIPSAAVECTELPRTANVKIDRSPRSVVAEADASALDLVGGLVSDTLGRSLSPDESIFDGGVTSMQAVAIASRATAATGTSLTVADVLQAETIRAISRLLTDGRGNTRELPHDIVEIANAPTAFSPAPAGGPVLVTGVTGTVGRRVMWNLLAEKEVSVLAPIRATDTTEAAARLLRAAAGSGRERSLQQALSSGRLVVTAQAVSDVVADTSVALSSIVHCAARVSAIAPFTALRADNVDLTRSMADGAESRGVPIVFLSTATTVGEDGGLAEFDRMPTGYAETKWAAEALLMRRGEAGRLCGAIVRLPRVINESVSRDGDEDFLLLLARVSSQVGCLPHTDLTEPMASIDDVATAVASLVDNDIANGIAVINLWNGVVPVLDVLGHWADSVPRVSLSSWRNAVHTAVLDDGDRAAALAWADILLRGFHRSWPSGSPGLVAHVEPAAVAEALGIRRLWVPRVPAH